MIIDKNLNEKDLAKVSRVILTSKCNEILHLILKSEFKDLITEFFFKDIDGFTALNPKKLYENNKEKNELIKKLNEMKDDEKRFYEKEKYIPLINLLNNQEKSVDILNY